MFISFAKSSYISCNFLGGVLEWITLVLDAWNSSCRRVFFGFLVILCWT